MIKMQCKINGQRIITLESCGINKIKDGDIFSIKEENIILPEIQFLISKNILSIVDDENSIKENIPKTRTTIFKCNIPKGRKLTLDSIKGSVKSGDKIEIDNLDLNNQDILYAIKNNLISEVKKESFTAKEDAAVVKEEITKEKNVAIKEEITKEEDITIKEDITKEEDLKTNKAIIDEILKEDIKEIESKKESPKFRISKDTQKDLENFAKEVYKKNSKTTKVLKPGTRKKKKNKKETKNEVNKDK